MNAPARPEILREFESRHSIKLPGDYCQYLTEVSNGGAGPKYGLIEIERAARGQVPSSPFPITKIECKPNNAPIDYNEIPGAVWLSDNGCATFDVMVVNGGLVGSVWTILEDKHQLLCNSFEKWFVGWLQSAIRTIQREPLLKSVRKEMHIDDIRRVFGNEIAPVPVEDRCNGYSVAFFDCNAHFFFNSEDRLLRIKHYSHQISPHIR